MYKGRDLAGTCGIPLECDRVYVEVECAPRGLYERADVPLRLIWPDGRSFPIRSTARRVEHGRAAFGNLVERFDVFIGKSEKVRTIWRQDGRWFVAKPKMRMPRPNSALLSQSKASSSVEPPEVAAPPARRRWPINPPIAGRIMH